MLKDIPYSELKKDKRAYEIMLRRDQFGTPFAAIAKEFEISTTRALQIYHKVKRKQLELYVNHIAAVGHEEKAQVRMLFESVYKCYQDMAYTCGYIEKKYAEILTAYRNGEPGMPYWFNRTIPPYRKKMTETQKAQIIMLREAEHKSFKEIGKELRMTPAKVEDVYDSFYHEKVSSMIHTLQERAGNGEEEQEIFEYYFTKRMSSKKRYEMLCKAVDEPS